MSLSKFVVEYNNRMKELGIRKPLFSAHQAYADKMGIPFGVSFEITKRCNFKCNMCYMRTDEEECNRNELSADEWIKLGKTAVEMGAVSLIITGGEPFLREDFKDIYTELSRMGLLISIMTNASLIDEKTIEWLLKCPPLSISISLYGTSRKTYDKLCHNPAGFDATMHAIELLEKTPLRFMVKSTIMEENIDDIATINKMAKDRNWLYVPFNLVDNARPDTKRKVDRPIFNFDGKEYCRNAEIDITPQNVKQQQRLEQMCRVQEGSNVVDRKGFLCTAGSCRCWITWYGQMQPCAMLDIPNANARTKGFRDAWNYVHNETTKLSNPKECISCSLLPMCRICPATHYLDSGKLGVKSNRICAMTKSRFSQI